MKLGFGKYKGEDICDVPIDYLKWAEEQEWIWENVRKEIQFEIKRREASESSLGQTTINWVVEGDRIKVRSGYIQNLNLDKQIKLFDLQNGQGIGWSYYPDFPEIRTLLGMPLK